MAATPSIKFDPKSFESDINDAVSLQKAVHEAVDAFVTWLTTNGAAFGLKVELNYCSPTPAPDAEFDLIIGRIKVSATEPTTNEPMLEFRKGCGQHVPTADFRIVMHGTPRERNIILRSETTSHMWHLLLEGVNACRFGNGEAGNFLLNLPLLLAGYRPQPPR